MLFTLPPASTRQAKRAMKAKMAKMDLIVLGWVWVYEWNFRGWNCRE